MDSWVETTLGTFVDSISETYRFADGEKVIFLNTSDIFKNSILTNQMQLASSLPGQAKKRIKKGDFLFSEIRPANGRFALIDFDAEKYVVSTKLMVLRCRHGLDENFLRIYLTAKHQIEYLQMLAEARSGTFPQITFDHISTMEVHIPPLPEQKAIAGVLSSLDDKINLLHRQNKTLEALAETLFRQWFIEEAEDNWEEVELRDYVVTNVDTAGKNDLTGEIRYLDTGSLTEGIIASYQPYQFADAPSRARRRVKHNDILISTVRPNQKHYGLMRFPDDDIIVSTGFCVITAQDISPYFLYTLLTSDDMTEYLHMIAEASTSAYPSLKPGDIEKLTFSKPPESKLLEFHNISGEHWKKIEKNHQQIQTLEKLRDTLLPKLMSGEVRVEYDREAA